jgi:hypothetical protein
VRPGREHDTTCARTHDGLLDALTDRIDQDHAVLADLGYEGESTPLTCPIKNTRGVTLTVDQRTINALHSATRALAERGNSLLKTTFKALRRVTLCPWRIGTITAAALVPVAPRAPPNDMINPRRGKAQHPLAGRRQSSDGFTVECRPRSHCGADQRRRHLSCPTSTRLAAYLPPPTSLAGATAGL